MMRLKKVSLLSERITRRDEYPFNIPAVASLKALEISSRVCFFVGENGTGKSTLLEAIAAHYGFGLEGGNRNFSPSTTASVNSIGPLVKALRLSFTTRTGAGFYMRAESFFNVASYVDAAGVSESYGGKSLHDQSHGESFLSLLQNRFTRSGFYLMDEPEAALSPQRQLSFLVLLHAFYYSGQNAHSLTVRNVHVGSLKNDPLPRLWRNLPAVEFCDPQPEGLDEVLLPNIEGRLNLPVKTSRKIHLEILENMTPYPSERRRPKLYADRLGVFLPILKTFSQLEVENGTVSISLLDFTRRKVIYEQDVQQGQVSWTDLKGAMAANSPTAVDVHDLKQGEEFGQYFWSEIAGRLEDAGSNGTMRVFIIISGPMELGSGKPIEIAPPARGNFAVFYLRCDFLQTPVLERSIFFAGEVALGEQKVERLEDGVGKALRQLKPRIFPLDSAQGVRGALATVLNDISRM